MGRLLEIARTLPVLVPPPRQAKAACKIKEVVCEKSVKSELSPGGETRLEPEVKIPVQSAPAFHPAASAVLGLIACADLPLPHPQIVRDMAGQGYSKDAAKQSIAYCQKRGWIEHNLTTGYVLCGRV